MATNIHFEARRRQMVLDKASRARKEMALTQQQSDGVAPSAQGPKPETIMCTDQGQFYQTRPRSELPRFRVNKDGHANRYRNRQHLRPHCDKVYTVLYPGNGNADYTDNPLRTFRRENSFTDAYEINKRVNGEFRMQLSARPRLET